MSAIKSVALENNLSVYQPENLQGENGQHIIGLLGKGVDAMIVVAYGLIVSSSILHAPRLGCINIHPSRLPAWRGAAPIQHTVLYGEGETAVTIMQMDAGMDSGPILSQTNYSVGDTETSAQLHDRLAVAGANDLLRTLDDLEAGEIVPQPQHHALATYTKKIHKADAVLDWTLSAAELACRVRAFNSWPVAYTHLHEQRLRVWRAEPVNMTEKVLGTPGTIACLTEKGMDVVTGDGVLRILELQCPGSKVMSVRDFVNSKAADITVGETTLS